MKATLSDRDVADLVLQRTNAFIRLGGGAALNHWFKTGEKAPLFSFLETTGQTKAFINAALSEIKGEFQVVQPFIADLNAKTVVSIGPGLGFFESLTYGVTKSNMILVDIEQSAEHAHGFASSGSGYSNLSSAKSFLVSNGADESRVQTCNPRMQPLPKEHFDILISLYSMGFHYPCSEYTSYILDGLRPGGLMILDKRSESEDPDWSSLASHFDVVHATPFPKSQRLILSRR